MTVIDDPAAAVAAGLCLSARFRNEQARTDRHPRRCGWCDYPTDTLDRMVTGWNAWAKDDRTGRLSFEARAFQGLPHSDQVRLVTEAQGFVDEPEPAPPEPMAVVTAPLPDEEEIPSWMVS